MHIPTWLQIVACVLVAYFAVTLVINSGTKKAMAKKKEAERLAKKKAGGKKKK